MVLRLLYEIPPACLITWRNAVKYKLHRFEINMVKDQGNLERFLNSLEGEVVAIIPNVTQLHSRSQPE